MLEAVIPLVSPCLSWVTAASIVSVSDVNGAARSLHSVGLAFTSMMDKRISRLLNSAAARPLRMAFPFERTLPVVTVFAW